MWVDTQTHTKFLQSFIFITKKRDCVHHRRSIACGSLIITTIIIIIIITIIIIIKIIIKTNNKNSNNNNSNELSLKAKGHWDVNLSLTIVMNILSVLSRDVIERRRAVSSEAC